MIAAILKTLLFTLVVPGTVAVLVPYRLAEPVPPIVFSLRTVGATILILLGAAGYAATALRFAVVGLGTPAPVSPTKTLVVSGLHLYVRNPMYISVLLFVTGEAALFHSWSVARYAVLLAFAFHLFILLYEEPVLRRQFGDSYTRYCAHTRRWFPRVSHQPALR